MTKHEITGKIVAIINDKVFHKCRMFETEINFESTFESLGFDSLDAVEIIIDIEKEFKILLTDDEINKINTINGIITLVSNKIFERTRNIYNPS